MKNEILRKDLSEANVPVVHLEKCTGCGLCAEICITAASISTLLFFRSTRMSGFSEQSVSGPVQRRRAWNYEGDSYILRSPQTQSLCSEKDYPYLEEGIPCLT